MRGTYVGTIRWGTGKTHYFRVRPRRTLCGRDAPYDWREVAGGMTYEAMRPVKARTSVDCRNCAFAATYDRLDDCVVIP
jgi:hypothetical protein